MPRWFREKTREASTPTGTRPTAALLGLSSEARSVTPEAHPEWSERPGLLRRLDGARGLRLVLLSAPAGSGKSALVTQWLAADQDRPAAWVTADRGLNAGDALWDALARAASTALPGMDDLRKHHRGPPLPHLITSLAALEQPVVLVLDDLHTLGDPDCLRSLEFFIDHLPPTTQLVLITRSEPALPLPQYRMAGDLLELRMADLAWTREEAATLVRRLSGMLLRDADLDRLLDATEGWTIALRLAALSLRISADPVEFVAEFSGTHRLIADYLHEEVLGSVAPELRRFLRRISVLDRFTAPLCDAVAGTANAVTLLQVVERANLFLVPLDDHRRWYRLHHMFRQTLRNDLADAEPDAVAQSHLRASDWYAGRGLILEATEHARESGALGHLTRLFEANWMEYVSTGRLDLVQSWMDATAGGRGEGDPVAAVCAAWLAALSGDRAATRHWVRLATTLRHEGPLPDGAPSLRFAVNLLRALFGYDGVPAMVESGWIACELEDDPTSRWYAPSRAGLAYGMYLMGDDKGALAFAAEAAQSGTSWPPFRIMALSVLALALCDLGRAAEAGEPARAAYGLSEDHGYIESPHAALPVAALGTVLAREGRPADARSLLEHALALRGGVVGLSGWPTLNLLTALADTCLDAGDRGAASAYLVQARHLLATEQDSGEHLRTKLAHVHARLTHLLPADPAKGTALTDILTVREEAVLRLLLENLSIREIGLQLFVSPNTVKTHTRSIYRKLGVTSRAEAVQLVRHLRLL
ncbi:LuxR C-terminal-related transcriptional regulator [Nonomuraea monospora]|uniref:LuxR C-terminal-related transcriptional regulator n=1 Tax=Nonomuraea monospora TaxID=568818 RepID=A0ABN3CEA7_9ACTN